MNMTAYAVRRHARGKKVVFSPLDAQIIGAYMGKGAEIGHIIFILLTFFKVDFQLTGYS